jgi:osmoprotectant transport system substrate-binding protein
MEGFRVTNSRQDCKTQWSRVQESLCRKLSVALLAPAVLLTACAPPHGDSIVVGAKNFTEQVVLGELLAQEIEAEFQAEGKPQAVGRRFYLAGSYLCQQALVSGRIDAYVEYSGTALTAILKQPLPPTHDEAAVFATISKLYEKRYQVRVEPGMGFEDTFAMVVRGDEAQKLGLRTISDLKQVHPPSGSGWRLGVGYEFQARPDGLAGLEKDYGLQFSQPRVMDLGLLYRALGSNQVDVVAGNSTDGPIRILGLQILRDDLHYFPPYEAVPLVREDSLAKHPEIQRAVARLKGSVTAAEMQAMNDAVDGKHEDAAEVVRRFRASKGL